ncbi:MAG: SHOCT domain-containing protein [Candidatus Mcinerneyibacterium aminivorans]|uniref:SHOCT domain-containing protein n=1 Tax=Candidatus Mcinerneyibacterium aminivorans TaxID=2703815 RepID=A0A5D0MK28_9BACT|nr:MAG: SHOCT domain-containing protein [Candidatus Mcinerneyibacterium aminivorans]
MHGYGHYFGFGGSFMWIFIIILVVVVIYVIARNSGSNILNTKSHQEHKEDAMEILKRRLAKGEISEEEFEEKKKILKNH